MPDPIDVRAVQARYTAALDAKPSKGEWTQRRIDALTDAVADVPALLAELQRLHDVGTGRVRHTYMGLCPDALEGPDVRDADCPACTILGPAPTKEHP